MALSGISCIIRSPWEVWIFRPMEPAVRTEGHCHQELALQLRSPPSQFPHLLTPDFFIFSTRLCNFRLCPVLLVLVTVMKHWGLNGHNWPCTSPQCLCVWTETKPPCPHLLLAFPLLATSSCTARCCSSPTAVIIGYILYLLVHCHGLKAKVVKKKDETIQCLPTKCPLSLFHLYYLILSLHASKIGDTHIWGILTLKEAET